MNNSSIQDGGACIHYGQQTAAAGRKTREHTIITIILVILAGPRVSGVVNDCRVSFRKYVVL